MIKSYQEKNSTNKNKINALQSCRYQYAFITCEHIPKILLSNELRGRWSSDGIFNSPHFKATFKQHIYR